MIFSTNYQKYNIHMTSPYPESIDRGESKFFSTNQIFLYFLIKSIKKFGLI
jgi:hypothetical protein